MTYEKIFYGKKKEKKKIRKMFYIFQIRKIFYRKMVWFSVDQKNIFRWPLIFRKTNTRKYWKYFPVNHFQWNKWTYMILQFQKLRSRVCLLGPPMINSFPYFLPSFKSNGFIKHWIVCYGRKKKIINKKNNTPTQLV